MSKSIGFRYPSISTSNLPSGVYVARLTQVSTYNNRVTIRFETPEGNHFTRSFNSAVKLNSKLLEFAQALSTPHPLHGFETLLEVLEALEQNIGRTYSVGYTILPGKLSLGNLSAVPLPSCLSSVITTGESHVE